MTPALPTDARDRFFADRSENTGIDLSVRLGPLTLANPVMPASGCFGPQLGELIPIGEVGAAVTKTVFAHPRAGNPAHRVSEIPGGMVNSVGIPSHGPRGYLTELHPRYEALGIPVIISVGGHRTSEYAPVVSELAGHGDGYEINVSCPNLDQDGVDIGSDPVAISEVVSSVRKETEKALIVKIPPLVANIAEIVRAAEHSGADAICVANSVPVLALHPATREPLLGNGVGGLSGPGVKPLVQRLVWLAGRAVEIPVIACGGIETADDVLDYLSLGASAVQIGTASFGRPYTLVDVVRKLQARCAAAGARTITALLKDSR